MKIKDLLKNVAVLNDVSNHENEEIDDLAINSKSEMKDALFFCYNGVERDSHEFVSEALKNGAKIFVVEKEIDSKYKQVLVKNTRSAMSIIACNFYGNPSKKMKVIGITGTNGKTTSAHFLAHILSNSSKKVGLIGTGGNFIDGKFVGKNLTTPDPIELQKLLANMAKNGITHCVMEVSAHAIALSKIDGMRFEIGAITNITQDHLDFFETIENYSMCKKSFFDKNHIRLGIINADDKSCADIIQKCNVPTVSYGINSPCDVFALDIALKISSSEFVVNLLDDIYMLKTNLVGKFNVYNTLTAITCAKMLGLSKQEIIDGVASFLPPKGRFSQCTVDGINVIIDFAHTPDGLENVLRTLKEISDGNIICVFGCGGNRDKNKRAKMARIAEKYSDFTVLTSDNPRFESPTEIALDAEKGFMTENHRTIIDRTSAIEFALSTAKKNDVVAILGKGAEDYIEVEGKKIPYSDFNVVLNYNLIGRK